MKHRESLKNCQNVRVCFLTYSNCGSNSQNVGVHFFHFLAFGIVNQIFKNIRCLLFSVSGMYVAIVWIKIVLKMLDVHFFQILASGHCESNYQNIGGPLFHFLAFSNCLNKNYSQIVGVRFFQFLASGYCESNSQNIGGPLFSPSGM